MNNNFIKLLILTIIALNNIEVNECYLNKDYFEKYKGFTLYKVIPEKELHLKQLNSIRIKYANKIEFWTEPRGLNQWLNIMASPLIKTQLEFDFTFVKMNFTISIQDLGILIEKQTNDKLFKTNNNDNKDNNSFNYTKYHTLDEINEWMISMQQVYPQLVTIINVTQSYENRSIYAIKISVPNERPNKKALWFDGGIHAREWIAPATVIYIAKTVYNYILFYFILL